jgi:hypothetical protein
MIGPRATPEEIIADAEQRGCACSDTGPCLAHYGAMTSQAKTRTRQAAGIKRGLRHQAPDRQRATRPSWPRTWPPRSARRRPPGG